VTPEREAEIRRWASEPQQLPCARIVHELLDELDRQRARSRKLLGELKRERARVRLLDADFLAALDRIAALERHVYYGGPRP
jgi:hypothetical protein